MIAVMVDSESTRGRYKVERVVERYNLEELPDMLERRWMGNGAEETSLRDLAREFNRAVMRQALESADRTPIEPELETMYAVLRGNDGSRADRTKVRRELERDGVDVEQLERDFVTHQAIHTYLTKGRGLTKSRTEKEPIERARDTIDRLRSRTAAVSESELDRLQTASAIDLGDADVLVQITVNCRDCGAYTNILDLLADGGCECEAESEESLPG